MNAKLLKQLQEIELKTQTINVAGFDEPIVVQQLDAEQAMEVSTMMVNMDTKKVDPQHMGAALVLATCYGLGFDKSQLPMVQKSPTLVSAVAPIAFELSGINPEAEDGQKKV